MRAVSFPTTLHYGKPVNTKSDVFVDNVQVR